MKTCPIGHWAEDWIVFFQLVSRNTIFWFMLMLCRVQGPRKMMPHTQQSLDLQTINFHSWLQFYEILYPHQLFFLLKVINGLSSLQSVHAEHISQAISIHRREHNFPTVLHFSWSKSQHPRWIFHSSTQRCLSIGLFFPQARRATSIKALIYTL